MKKSIIALAVAGAIVDMEKTYQPQRSSITEGLRRRIFWADRTLYTNPNSFLLEDLGHEDPFVQLTETIRRM